MDTTWTIERVQQNLPPITLRMPNGVMVQGEISGRSARFPLILAHSQEWDKLITVTCVTWETIVEILNAQRPLNIQ